MKKLFWTIFAIVSFLSCEKKASNLMLVNGTIDGLKKGTLFLQKVQDSALVDIDSLEIKGDANFSFEYELEGPEIFYLYLRKADNNDINDRITFFGHQDTITINTIWNRFDAAAEISGSALHEEFDNCQKMLSRFNTKDFEYTQLMFNEEYSSDSVALDSISALRSRNLLSRYKYVINFALTHTDSYVTPYLTLTEAADANPTYLDSIAKTLSPEVAASKYGKALERYVQGLQK